MCPRMCPRTEPGNRKSPAILMFPRDRGALTLAVTVGFEPTVGGYPTQLFESCTFGRSDTSPRTSLRDSAPPRESALTQAYVFARRSCLRREDTQVRMA